MADPVRSIPSVPPRNDPWIGCTFSCPAEYAPYVSSAISLALADVGRDIENRKNGVLPRIRDTLMNPKAEGRIVIVIGHESSKPEPF